MRIYAYYQFKRTDLGDYYESWELINRSGSSTKFDEMLDINQELTLKQIWIKERIGRNKFSLSGIDTEKRKTIQHEFWKEDHKDYASLLFNYSNEKSIILYYKRTINIFVYEGREPLMVNFFASKSKYAQHDKDMERQMSDLIDAAIPVSSIYING